MTRIYVDQPLQTGATLELPDNAARHVAQVLRMRPGQALTLFNGHGGEYAAELREAAKRKVLVEMGAFDPVERESRLQVHLAQCVSKGDRMDWAIQKAVELGVSRIIPVLSERSVVKLNDERWQKKLDHWRGVIIGACEQSGRTRLPELLPTCALSDYLSDESADHRWVLAPDAQASLPSTGVPTSIAVLIGPEGGLSERDLREAETAGFQRLHLGPRVLRTETAAAAILTALQLRFGDLGG